MGINPDQNWIDDDYNNYFQVQNILPLNFSCRQILFCNSKSGLKTGLNLDTNQLTHLKGMV